MVAVVITRVPVVPQADHSGGRRTQHDAGGRIVFAPAIHVDVPAGSGPRLRFQRRVGNRRPSIVVLGREAVGGDHGRAIGGPPLLAVRTRVSSFGVAGADDKENAGCICIVENLVDPTSIVAGSAAPLCSPSPRHVHNLVTVGNRLLDGLGHVVVIGGIRPVERQLGARRDTAPVGLVRRVRVPRVLPLIDAPCHDPHDDGVVVRAGRRVVVLIRRFPDHGACIGHPARSGTGPWTS